ncbi:MAG: lipid IV(A) 3-deoxy-D-manno-octulosonic acid transferase [Candidatus Igneacidithiobacillus chanchocoensis]
MMPRLYRLLTRLLTPLLLLFTWQRMLRRPVYRAHWRERFGWVPRRQDRPLWIHAVSVGEGMAALPLIHALQERYPQLPILLTSTTPGGRQVLRARLGDSVQQLYLPYDLPGAVARFLERQQPRLGLFLETEIWPNLIHAAAQRHIPLFLLNARLSARSLQGYQRWQGLFAPALAGLTQIAAQSTADAERFRALGAQRVTVAGQLKLDLQIRPEQRQAGALWRERFAGRRVWVFASTHPGEEELAADLLSILQTEFPDLLLVLIPRHPERAEEIVAALQRRGLRVARRSLDAQVAADTQVFLVDSFGEVIDFCAAADLVVMGGSFVPHGGHNPLEPAALAKPVLLGPHTENFASLVTEMAAAEALQVCADGNALRESLRTLLHDPAAAKALGERAGTWFAGQSGAVQRSLQLLAPYLEVESRA